MTTRELAAFLRSRRDRIRPESVGLPAGARRRSPGLRRAEVAQLAGISPDYYTRLEQGRDVRPSASVLDGLARGLRLNDHERDHLYRLAHSVPAPPRRRGHNGVAPEVRQLMAAMGPVPAMVLNGRLDVLAWNAMGAAIVPDVAEREPSSRNLVRFAFLDPRSRAYYIEWELSARHGIAQLRAETGRDPDDPVTRALVGDLAVRSEEFRALWAQHDVKGPGQGRKEFRHPAVGPLSLDYVVMLLPNTPDHQLVTYTAAPGSPSAGALDRLAAETAATAEAAQAAQAAQAAEQRA
ncbi:helix-turn-helix transcriptional regulator [Streptomyces radicis]|uniref:XRE family transcriptional regulator n=1 Tax=Streptomyces radicis TaxID=1750517 RepID=A0A3A9W3Y8_9ACTN|nr:helix-turn-helix transcriptional regulator [Streptomyces radicis]RKN07579.1 XRE family transcriptional regulator [Streptomyces radicis]RKN18302.1 XRE family transcriptional regulator [Streptomyces radicis]